MKLAALLALLIATSAAAQVGPVHERGWTLRPEAQKPSYWDRQATRLAVSLGALKKQDPGRRDTYVLAVAAGGAQPLFDHEAKRAATVLSAYFGESGRALLLSNREPETEVAFATPTNLAGALAGIGRLIDPGKDLVVVYLAAHGAPEAALETNLPGSLPLPAIDAAGLARALDAAGIKRRVIIVSACFAGSWTAALASDTTIVMAAARRDRTSFGCELDRKITYFGEALLDGAISPHVPLATAFAVARKTIAVREVAERLTPPSDPQASVGRAMTMVWNQAP